VPDTNALQLLLRNNEGIKALIVTHRDPDLDAIGSTLALYQQFQQHNIPAEICVPEPLGTEFSFLPHASDIRPVAPESLAYNTVFALDSSRLERIPLYEQLSPSAKLINIDHHGDNSLFGDLNIVHEISSVGELLMSLFDRMDWSMDKDIATCLFAAIAFDTGNFRFSNTNSETLRVAARLLDEGIDHPKIIQSIFEHKPDSFFETLRTALSNLHINKKLEYGYTKIPNCPRSAGHDIIDIIRLSQDVEVVLVFRGSDTNEVKISIRSKNRFDVAKFAAIFGGGGHKRAAGIRLQGSLDEIEKAVVQRLEAELKKGDSDES